MTREEMLRILSFTDTTRAISEKRTALASVDPRWNIISYAMRRHLEGKLMTKTSVAMAADVPYGTAMRRIEDLIETGYLLKRPRSSSGKSFSLHPTRKLIEEFESYAMQLKAMVGSTFGFNANDGVIENFYFGGYYMASRILSYPNAMRTGVGYNRSIRILGPMDPTFKTMSDFSANLGELCGTNIEVCNLSLDDLYQEIMENAARARSRYDLVAVDLPWIGQLAEEKVIESLDDIIHAEHYNASDFHNTAWKGSSYGGEQYGLPIQPTAELLFCRSDLFAEAGLAIPRTTNDVLFAARMLHHTSHKLSGIVMNYGRGIPVAHSFIQTLASFGQPLINLKVLGDDFDVEHLDAENFRPMIDTEAGRQTAAYLLELLNYAHPDSLHCDWDHRMQIFAKGQAAMSYGWTIRAALFALDETSAAHGKVEFVPHPHGPEARTVSPIGGFSLAMPAGLTEERRKSAWKVMEYLTRPELMKWYVQNGNLSSPRFSTSADPEVLTASPLIGLVDAMERRGQLQIWPRPPVPEFNQIVSVLGTEIHDMLRGEQSIEAALKSSQNRVDGIMRANGRY